MHQAAGEEPFRNQGSVIHLSLPDYATPDVQHFDAVMPRPPVSALRCDTAGMPCGLFGTRGACMHTLLQCMAAVGMCAAGLLHGISESFC